MVEKQVGRKGEGGGEEEIRRERTVGNEGNQGLRLAGISGKDKGTEENDVSPSVRKVGKGETERREGEKRRG